MLRCKSLMGLLVAAILIIGGCVDKRNKKKVSQSFVVDSIEVHQVLSDEVDDLKRCRMVYFISSNSPIEDSICCIKIYDGNLSLYKYDINTVSKDSVFVYEITAFLHPDETRFKSINQVIKEHPELLYFHDAALVNEEKDILIDSVHTTPETRISFWLDGKYVSKTDTKTLNKTYTTLDILSLDSVIRKRHY